MTWESYPRETSNNNASLIQQELERDDRIKDAINLYVCMELGNRKDTSQREIFIPRSRGFPVARAQNMKGWAKTSPPLLLNGANVPDNLIEKEIPLKIPPHSLAKCNCVQKFALLLQDIFLDQEFSSWHGESWQQTINFIIKGLIGILSHWIGNWVKSWFNLFSSFHIPMQIWKCRTDSFKSGTANRIQRQWLYKHLQIQCGCILHCSDKLMLKQLWRPSIRYV